MTVTAGGVMASSGLPRHEGRARQPEGDLVCNENPNGKGVLYRFRATGDLAMINRQLVQDGIAFHTLVPSTAAAASSSRPVIRPSSADQPLKLSSVICRRPMRSTSRACRPDPRRLVFELLRRILPTRVRFSLGRLTFCLLLIGCFRSPSRMLLALRS